MKECKSCNLQKEYEDFYRHPLTKDLRMAKCKECIKSERRTPEGREKARIQDLKRAKNPKRIAQKKKTLYSFRERNPIKWQAQYAVGNFLRYHKDLKPKKSTVSGAEGLLHLHHHDYSKPNEVIPCTPKEHSDFHHGRLQVLPQYIIVLPF